MKEPQARIGGGYDPAQFLKCPECHRSNTVSLTIHPDGDATIDCEACDAHASVMGLNESSRVYETT